MSFGMLPDVVKRAMNSGGIRTLNNSDEITDITASSGTTEQSISEGTNKWNKIEHGLLSFINLLQSRRKKGLRSQLDTGSFISQGH